MVDTVEAAGAGIESNTRPRRPMEVPADLESRFLLVGDTLLRGAQQ